jgi:hypothetical protein
MIRKLSGATQGCRQHWQRKSVRGFEVLKRRSAHRESSKAARIAYWEQQPRLVKMHVKRSLAVREAQDFVHEVEFTRGVHPSDVDWHLVHAESASFPLDVELHHKVQAVRQHIPIAGPRVLPLGGDRDCDDRTGKPLTVAPPAGHGLDRGITLANAFRHQTGKERERDE